MPPPPDAPAAPPGPAGPGWREELAEFPGGEGRRLAGVLARPEPPASAPRPAVLVVHGWGTHRCGPHRMLVELCRELAARGLAALRFDLSGRGDSPGEFWSVGLDEMIADALAAGRWLLDATGAPALAAAGLCSGANVALAAAAADERVAAVAALSALPFQKQRGAAQGAARSRAALGELVRRALRPETWRRLLSGEASPRRVLARLLGGEGGKSARAGAAGRNLKDSKREVHEELGAYRGRLLFVFGELDAEGLSGWEKVFAPHLAARGVARRRLVVPDSDHDFHGLEAKRQAIAAVAEFLAGGGS